jgi:hypothetical protein
MRPPRRLAGIFDGVSLEHSAIGDDSSLRRSAWPLSLLSTDQTKPAPLADDVLQGAFGLVCYTCQSIPTIQVFDCRALFLYLLARQVPRAAGGILRFAGQPLGDAVGRQLRISDESA